MATIVKRPRAELDLLDIWDYIADDSLDRGASHFGKYIKLKVDR